MKKNVVFFIGTLSGGGAERAVSNISLNLSDEIKQKIILFGKNKKIVYPHKAEIVNLDNYNEKNTVSKIISLVKRVHKVSKLKQKKDVTFISFLEYPNLINALTSNKAKTYVSIRNHMSTKHKKGAKAFLWNKTIKNLYSKTDGIISVSNEIKNDLINNYNIDENKIKVLNNSYSIDDIQISAEESIEEEYKYIFENPVVITTGRLNKQKAQWHIIRAFKKVKDQVSNAKLVILGEGKLYKYLSELSSELGLKNDVHFLGFKNNPFKYIKNSKVFVMTSLHEGFPNALAEAMATGVPVISSDCLSGPIEILAPQEIENEKISYEISQDRYGMLIPNFDGNMYGYNDPMTVEESILSQQIVDLLTQSSLNQYFSKRSSTRIKDFNINQIIKAWENII